MSETVDAIVIGGGVHGASIAFHLAQRKMSVMLLEKKFFAAGGTGKSTALVRQHYDNYLESKLTYESWKYFMNWKDIVGGEDAGFVQTGFIRTVIPEELAALHANTEMHRQIGIRTEVLAAAQVQQLEPNWDVSDLEYVAYEPESGYADPHATTLSFAERARDLGAQLQQETSVQAINVHHNRVLGVTTDKLGEISAPHVIVAAGPWTPQLVKPIGIDLPITCERHQVASFVLPAGVSVRVCCLDGAKEMYFRPEGRDLILVGCGVGSKQIDPDRYNEAIDDTQIEHSADRIAKRIPRLMDGLSQGGWAGFYDMTPDEKCIFGALPIQGLFVNAGHSGTGFKIAPALGLAMSELVCDGVTKSVDLTPLRWSRFKDGQSYFGAHSYSTSWHTGNVGIPKG